MSWFVFGTNNAPINRRTRRKTVSFTALEGSSHAAVAQWIEYWPPKPRVAGPIPASRTRNIKVNQRVTRFGWWPFFIGRTVCCVVLPCLRKIEQSLFLSSTAHTFWDATEIFRSTLLTDNDTARCTAFPPPAQCAELWQSCWKENMAKICSGNTVPQDGTE